MDIVTLCHLSMQSFDVLCCKIPFYTHNLTKIDEKSLRPLIVPDNVQKSSNSSSADVKLIAKTLMSKVITLKFIFKHYFSLNLNLIQLENSFKNVRVLMMMAKIYSHIQKVS